MKKIKMAAALIGAILVGTTLVSCAGGPASSAAANSDAPQSTASAPAEPSVPQSMAQAYKTISPDQAKEIMMGQEPFILLDVRTEEEFKAQHIEGAVLIPDYELAERAAAELPDKDALILIYCRSGRRSASAAKTLAEMGYTNINDMGGITSWPYETVGN